MKKKLIENRSKLTTKTYMKEVEDYECLIIKRNEDYLITIKKVLKTTKPFSVFQFDQNIVHIDNGYYIVEITPINDNYNFRVYLDKNKNIIDYYFDICLFNGVMDKVPFYVDLYLDVLYYPNQKDLVIYADKDELDEALENKSITKKDYKLAIKTGDKLFKELSNKTNKFVNMDIVNIINKYNL